MDKRALRCCSHTHGAAELPRTTRAQTEQRDTQARPSENSMRHSPRASSRYGGQVPLNASKPTDALVVFVLKSCTVLSVSDGWISVVMASDGFDRDQPAHHPMRAAILPRAFCKSAAVNAGGGQPDGSGLRTQQPASPDPGSQQ